jgi:hypothetical protein
LVCATFGRGFYVLDDYSPLRSLVDVAEQDAAAHLFAPRKTAWFVETSVEPTGFLGDDYFTASNPPAGAVFTFHLRDSEQTAREQRRKREREAAAAQEDVEVPSFEELAAESAEPEAKIAIEIRDGAGNLISRVACPTSAGLHRVAWDMRQTIPVVSSPQPLAAPGTYAAQLVRMKGAEVETLSEPVEVVLEAIFDPTLTPVAREEAIAFTKTVSQLLARWRHVSRSHARLEDELSGRRRLVEQAAADAGGLLTAVEAAAELSRELTRMLEGDEEKRSRFVLDVPTAGERLQRALYQAAGSTYGPTGTSREQVEIAQPEVAAAEEQLQRLTEAVAALGEAMDNAGLVWVE